MYIPPREGTKHNTTSNTIHRTHKCALFSNLRLFLSSLTALRKLLSSSELSLGGAAAPFPFPFPSAGRTASSNSLLPSASVSPSTRVLTVAPSRRFLPSRRLDAVFSVKSHSRPDATRAPVAGSRGGVHSGARRRRGGTFASLDLTTWMMPSSSKRWYEFFSVSLLTASK